MTSQIAVTTEGEKATVTIDRPEKNNALTAGMYADLLDVFQRFEDDESLSVVTIRGAGDHFSAGVDVGPVPEWGEATPRTIREQYEVTHELLRTIESLGVPVVAALDGYALGGALELAISCDIRVAHADAQLGLPEANLGFSMDQGGPQKLPGMIGEGMTKYLVMTGKLIDGQRAHEIGLVEEVAESAEAFETQVEALEDRLEGQPTYVMDMAKRQIHGVRPQNLDEEMARAIHHAITAYKEPETQRRTAEFLGE
ncbi:enoyl-CoA hydratase/isomerase family protein [Haladaptatus sp. YSMS36]|uniref:enoyl-CoA hydratase/isomerase family protein n=1 Tax=Haladaptatus sp. YSMS36 TaxID=3033384 RepID=UPI0023E75A0E|nr:enoyl-CoA hydratase/isomerase family protein [Haladaptatus sp. YSMS36]